MHKKIMLIGEPMELLISQDEGNLEDVSNFKASVAGAELNVAIGLSRLGHNVSYISKLGKDIFGKQIKKYIEENKIGTSLISENFSTGFMLKSKSISGNPDIYYCRKNSAASSLSPEELNKIEFSQYGYIHITGIFPALSENTWNTVMWIIKKAKEYDIKIFFDPNIRPQLWGEEKKMIESINYLAKQSDYFLPGINEARILTGINDPESIARYYINKGIKCVIIKLGEEGAYFLNKKEEGYVNGYNVKVVDTVGAGDGFAAGIISGILEGISLEEACLRGNAIGALQVTSIGDNQKLPNRRELKEFMNI